MSAPIPSFFKIRVGIVIILLLLFFFFLGMMKQVLASTCTPIDHSVAGWGLQSVDYYASVAAVDAACVGDCGQFDCTDASCSGWYGDAAFKGYYLRWKDTTDHKHIIFAYCSSTSSCLDSDDNGIPDVCETCPKQQGYKTNLLIASYCGNTITQCDGSSHTSYEWGFGPDSCTPVADQPCHVTADCKKDLNQDGIADGLESGVAGGVYDPHNLTADLNGNGIPDIKDCDYDYDHDGIPNCNDPCPNNPSSACTNPCTNSLDAACKDSDGDGIADSYDLCPQNPDTNCDDSAQKDSDGDGKLDSEDPCPHTACVNPCAGSSDTNCKDSDGDGISDDKDKCPNNPDTSCTDPGSGNGDGTDTQTKPYTPKEAAYTHTSDIDTRFGDRFQKFIADMRQTSFFSIPGQIFGDIPTGGSPSFEFDGGTTYGKQTISMDSWSRGLAALRGVLYILACWAAVKIALLGK